MRLAVASDNQKTHDRCQPWVVVEFFFKRDKSRRRGRL
jgi:hypothetical protein